MWYSKGQDDMERKVCKDMRGSLTVDDGGCDRTDFFCLSLLTALLIYLSPAMFSIDLCVSAAAYVRCRGPCGTPAAR